ncbi:MAG: AraC family transcriptional regulator [Oscillospiraceae bacterium]
MSNKRYYIQDVPDTASDVRLLYVSTSKYEGDWHSTMHTHYFSELFYVVSGKGSFMVQDDVFEVGADDMVIVNPNVEHTERSVNQHPLEYIVLGVDGLTFSFDQGKNSSYSKDTYSNLRKPLTFYLSTMIAEMESKPENYQILCQDLLEIFLITISRHANLSYFTSSGLKESKEIASVKRYLETNYKENVSLDELSAICHLNKYYLVHNFKKTYGITPINFLIERRIEECKYLLETTDYSLSQIAQIAGFSSLSYFSQSFKKMVKLSPNDYRKKTR